MSFSDALFSREGTTDVTKSCREDGPTVQTKAQGVGLGDVGGVVVCEGLGDP